MVVLDKTTREGEGIPPFVLKAYPRSHFEILSCHLKILEKGPLIFETLFVRPRSRSE